MKDQTNLLTGVDTLSTQQAIIDELKKLEGRLLEVYNESGYDRTEDSAYIHALSEIVGTITQKSFAVNQVIDSTKQRLQVDGYEKKIKAVKDQLSKRLDGKFMIRKAGNARTPYYNLFYDHPSKGNKDTIREILDSQGFADCLSAAVDGTYGYRVKLRLRD